MNFTFWDWAIVLAMLTVLVTMAMLSSRHAKSVTDFLAAGRGAGRYMMVMAQGMVWIGAINVVAMFEMYDAAGFGPMWWVMLTTPFVLYLNITGFGVYRFRETRALTVAQFLESRYSRGVRIFAGILSWVTGLLYFGIFPAVGARFFMAFCQLPDKFMVLGLQLSSFPIVMFALLAISLFFVFAGGHVAVIVTDCLQGIFTQIGAIVIIVVMAWLWLDWDKVVEVLKMAPSNAESSHLDPINAKRAEGGFNFWFFIIGIGMMWYGVMSNLQGQAYVASAKSAHEFRIGWALNQWRWLALLLFFIVLVLCAKVVMFHPTHADLSMAITSDLDKISMDPGDSLRKQVTVTTALSHIMPTGLLGIFAAVMLAALISTYDSFLHTWGSVFLQDVVMPFRKKPFGNKLHIRLLRLSILGVSVIAFLISWLLFSFQDNLMMYFAAINSIWLGGAGAVILGGLYWRRGTTLAATVTLILGTVLGIASFICTQFWPDFPVNAQWLFLWTMVICVVAYVGISLLGDTKFNMDKLLHRGEYAIDSDRENLNKRREDINWFHRIFGIDAEFNSKDRLIAYLIVGWFLVWLGVFVVGTWYGIFFNPSEDAWAVFWQVYLWILFGLSIVVTIWFSWGGIKDILSLFRSLKTQEKDLAEDGMVNKED